MATIIQAAWRSYSLPLNYCFLLSSVLEVQIAVRQMIALRKLKTLRLECKALQLRVKTRCAIMLQTKWRSCDCSSRYLVMSFDALLIQSLFRQFTAIRRKKLLCEDRENNMATRIQAIWRSFIRHINYLHYLSCILVVQCQARQWIALQQKRILKGVLIKIQHQVLIGCTIAIQTHWRAYHCSSRYLLVLMHTVLIQSQVRRLISLKSTLFMNSIEEMETATIVQAAWRSYSYSLRYICFLSSVLDIQSAVRQRIAVRQIKTMMLDRKETHFRENIRFASRSLCRRTGGLMFALANI